MKEPVAALLALVAIVPIMFGLYFVVTQNWHAATGIGLLVYLLKTIEAILLRRIINEQQRAPLKNTHRLPIT